MREPGENRFVSYCMLVLRVKEPVFNLCSLCVRFNGRVEFTDKLTFQACDTDVAFGDRLWA